MDQPQRLDVYQVELLLGYSTDARPCIVIDSPNADGCVPVVPLSGNMDLYRGKPDDLLIESGHPDFAATGLAKTCFAIGDRIRSVPARRLLRKRGHLRGDLARAFDAWI